MKVLKHLAILVWRIWFFGWAIGTIVVALPVLIVATWREEWYPFFFKIARGWAKFILFGMGFVPKIKREVIYQKGQSYMFVANHTSMTDIMLMLYVSKNPFVFVGKKELARIPIFGFFYKRSCILVDRKDSKSRMEVFESAQKKINMGYSICIFPEGGVPDDESIVLDNFKDGAFRLAIEHQIPIAPMTFLDNKKRFSYTFFSGGPGKLRVKVHNLISTTNYTSADKKELNIKTREMILTELKKESI